MPKIGSYTSCSTLSKLDGRTKSARLVQSLRSELLAYAGHQPSVTQRLLIDQAAETQLRLAALNQKAEFSDQDSRTYLDLNVSLAQLLQQIDLKASAASKTDLAAGMRQEIAA